MNEILNGHEEIQLLLGAFALDAVSPSEHEAVALHVELCDECRAEVREHLEVAADLSALAIEAPPPDLWDRIVIDLDAAAADGDGPGAPALRLLTSPRDLASATGTPAATGTPVAGAARPEPAARREVPRRARGRWLTVGSLVAAAAAVITVLAVGWLRASDRASQLEDVAARPALDLAADRALADPANRHLDLKTPGGDVTAVAVVTPQGEGYVVPRGLPVLPDDRTYQLWQIGASGPVSLGVLGNEPGVRAFHLQGPVMTLALTDEVAGGRALPAGTPLASGTA